MFSFDSCPTMLLNELSTIFNRKSLYLIGAGASISYLKPQKSSWYSNSIRLIEKYSPFSGFTLDQNYQIKEDKFVKFKIAGFPYEVNYRDNKYFINTTEFDFNDYLLSNFK